MEALSGGRGGGETFVPLALKDESDAIHKGQCQYRLRPDYYN